MDPDRFLDLSGAERWRRWDTRPGAPGPLVAEFRLAAYEARCWAAFAATQTMAAEAEMDPTEAARLRRDALDAWAQAGEWTA